MQEKTVSMMDNVTVVTMLTLSGLNGTANYRVTLFAFTLLCYGVVWVANFTIILTIIVNRSLREPMYIFLCNLCINGLYGTAGFYPKFLHDLLSPTHVISYAGCLLQGFVLHSSFGADLSFLLLMAYDRYVAICQPLIYNSVMTKGKIGIFVFIAWIIPIYLVLMGTITTSFSKLCGSHIPKLYCINFLVGKLACSASLASIIIPVFNYTFYSLHFVLIFWSYMYLVKKFRVSRENRSKFMQTCLPHLVCLNTFFLCMFFDLMYVRFGQNNVSQSVENFMAIEYLLIPPIINPVIYGLKLTKIRQTVLQFLLGNK